MGRASSVPAGVTLGHAEGPTVMRLPIGGGYVRPYAHSLEEGNRNLAVAGEAGSGSASSPSPGPLKVPSVPTKQVSDPAEMPEEDFVEGGVELSPKKVDSPRERKPLDTQLLSELSSEEVQRFWPSRSEPKALFLDYDGTLREFEARPELAVPTTELEELLKALNEREDFVPHIISGRDAKFLGNYFGSLNRFTLIAEHGFQISPRPESGSERKWELWEQYGGDVNHFRDHENWKVIMRKEISRLVEQTPGSHLEEKQSSLVWHYREVADEEFGEAAAAEAIVVLEQLRSRQRIQDVKIVRGHKVVEVSYRNVRKGLVMRRLCEEKALFGEPYAAVLAAGDDVSDETMFEAAPHDFLTIKVGKGVTLARFRVESPAELRDFLQQLLFLEPLHG